MDRGYDAGQPVHGQDHDAEHEMFLLADQSDPLSEIGENVAQGNGKIYKNHF